MLSNIILYPLTQIIEVVYLAVHKVFKSFPCPAGFAIIGVSVAITFLCLPLYVIAEKWQQIERDTQKKLKPGIDRIKAVFKGDEQYMILSTFYRQNHYHPMMALRSSFGLLIQVPFFMAAYSYLSNLDELKGLSFLFIRDLGNPDATFTIGNFPVNILPIAMTLINCVAGAIYTKGFGWKDKLQVYGMAGLFLVILYNSPAGLVLYWTMNNVFSLVKNVFYKLKHPLWTLYFICCAFILGADWFILFKHTGFLYRRIMLIGLLSVVFFIPLILKLINYMLKTVLKPLVEDKKTCALLFWSSAFLLCFLLGLYVPGSVISASPQEFSFIENIASPFVYLRITFYKAIGLCVFWPVCIYYLFGKEVKACISSIFACLALGAIVNIFIFHGTYGNLSVIMNLDNAGALKAAKSASLINMTVMLFVIALILVLTGLKKGKWINTIWWFVSSALVIVSFINFGKTNKGYKALAEIKKENTKPATLSPIFNLSKTEPNVFVLDMDRFTGTYMSEILSERPELFQQMDGFTFYPNTASFGECTIIGSPAMFGGYDYTPQSFTVRSKDTMVTKHNEAITVMPRIFAEKGFDVTVTDTSFANYSWISDLSVFEPYKEIKAIRTIGSYTDMWLQEHPDACGDSVMSGLIKRNILIYSIMRSLPLFFRDTVYNDGKYWNTEVSVADMQAFINSYSVLDYLGQLTDFSNPKPTYTFMVNEATHEPAFLQYPDYTPSSKVTNKGNGEFSESSQYHASIGSMIKIAEWISFLKESGVYDNTRIILTSDHGFDLKKEGYPNAVLNPILFVKDFNQHGEMKIDKTLMTNADSAYLSVEGLIENPINPYSGKTLSKGNKQEPLYGAFVEGWAPDKQFKYSYRVTNWFKLTNGVLDNESQIEVSQDEALEAFANK